MSKTEKQKQIAKHVNKLTLNLNRWLVKECLDKNLMLTEDMTLLMEKQIQKNLQSFYFDAIKAYEFLKPKLNLQEDLPPQDFLIDPVQYLIIKEQFKNIKCRAPGDFPINGADKTVYTATSANRHYLYNDELKSYTRIPTNSKFI